MGEVFQNWAEVLDGGLREKMDPDRGAGSRVRVRRRINVKKRRRGEGEAHMSYPMLSVCENNEHLARPEL
jgi:hypothetical protein